MTVIWALAQPAVLSLATGVKGITTDLLADVKLQVESNIEGATILETRGNVHALGLSVFSAAALWSMGLQVCSFAKGNAGQAAFEDPADTWSDWFCYLAKSQSGHTEEVAAGVFVDEGQNWECNSGGQRKLSRGNNEVRAVFRNSSAITMNFQVSFQFLIKLP